MKSLTGHGMANCICVEDDFCEGDCLAMDCNQERPQSGTAKPLTDAELDDIITDHVDCGWEGDDGCPHCKMARELRALRADRWDWERVEAAVEINKRVAKLRAENSAHWAELQDIYTRNEELVAENAKLVAALGAIARRGPIMGSRDEYRRGQLDALEACREVANDALASVKGEQG